MGLGGVGLRNGHKNLSILMKIIGGKILTSQNYSVILYRAFVTTARVLGLRMRAMKLNCHMMLCILDAANKGGYSSPVLAGLRIEEQNEKL